MSTEFSTVSFPSLHGGGRDIRHDQARASGHAAGYTAGLRAAEKEIAARVAAVEAEHAATALHARARLDRAVALLSAAANALEARTVPVLEEAQAAIAEGAVQLAEAVVGSALGDAGTAARSALERALTSVDVGTLSCVRMNPADLDLIGQSTLDATGVTFVRDATLAPGDAISELPDGYLDARIGTALDRAREALTEGPS
ncbi:MAG: hypothetical protein JWM51_687 [Microbacteriaceae bacterium]|nr:hypothetical protein [Microbacteriaceae bacterium]